MPIRSPAATAALRTAVVLLMVALSLGGCTGRDDGAARPGAAGGRTSPAGLAPTDGPTGADEPARVEVDRAESGGAATSARSGTRDGSPVTHTIRIAEQFGLAYAPLVVARELGLFEQALPDYRITWVRLQNAAAIREAMVAGRLDVGFMGIPPFLIGADRGMDWRIFTGLSRAPLMLVSNREGVSSLSDLDAQDRIALPQPGSIQHILLAMAADRELGSPTVFDSRLVSLSHPDALSALTNRTGVTAYFGSPPYVQAAVHQGATAVVTGEEAFGGPFTFIIGVADGGFAREHPAALEAVRKVLTRANRLVDTAEGLNVLARQFDLKRDEVTELLATEGLVYETDVRGVERFVAFMRETGYLDRVDDPHEDTR